MDDKIQLVKSAPPTRLERLEEIYMLIRGASEEAYALMEQDQEDGNANAAADLNAVCIMLNTSKDTVEGIQEFDDDFDGALDHQPLPAKSEPAPSTVLVECSGGLVREVYDQNGNVLSGYEIVDHDSWEGGECPFCQSVNTKHVDGKDNGKFIIGGHMKCLDCGCDEGTDVAEWIRSRNNLKEMDIESESDLDPADMMYSLDA